MDISRINTNNNLLFLRSLFRNSRRRNEVVDGEEAAFSPENKSPKPIPTLSPLANSVVARCSRILQIPTEELHHCFDMEVPDTVKQPSVYARNLLEFCSYKALHVATGRTEYLGDKDFRRLMFDMMLAWEAPRSEDEPLDNETAFHGNRKVDDEDGWSLFYSSSTSMAVQVDNKKTAGQEAFSRIAPTCAVVADIITVHNLFDALTSSSGGRLHFLIYDKYLRSLEKVIKAANNSVGPQLISNFQLPEGEIILDADGTVPTQPVLQHVGISAWPGRLTLTSHALYFESLGVGLHEKPVRYDLVEDLKQVIKPELTGPLGARLFDKAVMYKSSSIPEPVYFEFPEFKGSSRRDYWLDICLEMLHVHKFIRKYNLKENQRSEALARAMLGIFQCRAIREAVQIFSSHYKTLLCFNLAESLPRGDLILETLSSRLALVNNSSNQRVMVGSPTAKRRMSVPVSLMTLSRLGIILQKERDVDDEEIASPVGNVCVGETSLLEMAVKQSRQDVGRAEAAQATVDQVKVEGIDTNLAVMKELLLPLAKSLTFFQHLASWEDLSKSTVFVLLISYAILRGWVKYLLSSIFVFIAVLMLWRGRVSKRRQLDAFNIIAPPNKNAVEQLVMLQEAITQLESLIQSGNIILLKLRAVLFGLLPQATDRVAIVLVFMAVVFAFLPVKYLTAIGFIEYFTREMPLRRYSSDRWMRRVREWWTRIPAAPVQLIKSEDKKRK